MYTINNGAIETAIPREERRKAGVFLLSMSRRETVYVTAPDKWDFGRIDGNAEAAMPCAKPPGLYLLRFFGVTLGAVVSSLFLDVWESTPVGVIDVSSLRQFHGHNIMAD